MNNILADRAVIRLHEEKVTLIKKVEILEAQLAEKDKLLLTAFVDSKAGVHQMTRKYDGWLSYLKEKHWRMNHE